MRYVQYNFKRPVVWATTQDEEGWPLHVEAVLRRQAIDAGVTLIGAAEQVGDAEPTVVDTDTGPVNALLVTYRGAVSEPPAIDSSTVEAVETEPGVWVADVPTGAPIVSVKHGLATYEIDVDAEGADGKPTGYHGPFVPVSRDEVEVVPGATTRRLIITLLEVDDPRIAEAEMERDHATNEDAPSGWGG